MTRSGGLPSALNLIQPIKVWSTSATKSSFSEIAESSSHLKVLSFENLIICPAMVAGLGAMLQLDTDTIYQAIQQAVHVSFSTRQSRKGEISSWKAYAPAHAGNRQCKADHAVVCKRAQNLPSRFGGHNEKRQGKNVDIGRSPDRAFDFDAGSEFRQPGTGAHRDLQRFFFDGFGIFGDGCHADSPAC